MTNINQLLTALPIEDFQRLAPQLLLSPLRSGQVLQKKGEPLTRVWFLSRNLCSWTMPTDDGAAPEIVMVGPEGIVGVEAVLRLPYALCDAAVHIVGDGVAHVMTVEAFRNELEQGGALYFGVRAFAETALHFATQSAICNALHPVERRCCRWLLQAQDRLMSSALPITQDVLAEMLGVRRPTITLAISKLVALGILSTTRGMLTIADRTALEARSCECYRHVRELSVGQAALSTTQPVGAASSSVLRPVLTH